MYFSQAKGILSSQNGMNVYRGCTHGCIYCDSRSSCYNMQHDFEDVEVKINAPQLLEKALRSKKSRCMIGTGAMCDPYMHCEAEQKITRKCLEIIEKYGFGVSLLTKSDMILRDLELLKSINAKAKCVVQMTLTTFDEQLCRIIEPNVCTTKRRAEVLQILHENGIPTVIWLCPVLPFINDNEQNINGILQYAVDAKVNGVLCFGMGLTLREGDREYYYKKLDEHFPGLKEKYIKRYGQSYSLECESSGKLLSLYHKKCDSAGIMHNTEQIFTFLNKFEDKTAKNQLTLY